MSADLMLISTKQEQTFENNQNQCVQIDETSMGDPWTDFGKLMRSQTYTVIDDAFIAKVKHWWEVLEHGDYELSSIVGWLESHKGESLEMEGW